MNEPKPKRRRRWYQFSLRSLMLFMLVCAIVSVCAMVFGWLGKSRQETERERLAIAKTEALLAGGRWVVLYRTPGPTW